MSAPTSQEVLHQTLHAFDRHDWTIFEQHPGLHETRLHLPPLYAAFPDLSHTIETELVNGSLVGCVALVRGTHQGSFMGIAPTGKPVQFMLLIIDRIVDGTIVEHWAIPDFMSLFGQLGVTLSFQPREEKP
ncbi:MAG TPA: ester cyclase [Ktedonobacteraceae bacterium]|nr:ester cyclase [Ktedonobacteraceae bacterium]